MTATEFLALPESNQPTELIHGALIVSPSPVPRHQTVLFKVAKLIEATMSGGQVFIAPLDVHFDDDNVLQPDVLWLADESQCMVLETHLAGVPELVVEVHSPGTTRRDRREKFDLYEQFGVAEYWMIDPHEQFIEVYQRENGPFVRRGAFGVQDTSMSISCARKISTD